MVFQNPSPCGGGFFYGQVGTSTDTSCSIDFNAILSMRKEAILLFILAVAQFTHIIDFMIVMPLGAQFMEIFDISPRQFSWIVSSYAISACVAGLLGAMYLDRYDRKVALLFCYVGFTLGTFACSMADSFEMLLLSRSFTGMFGGVLGALVLAIVADAVPLERRGKAMGLIMTAFSVASVIGVPTGLWLAASFGWRMPFMVVGGVACLTILAILRWVPALRGHLQREESVRSGMFVLSSILHDRNQLRALLFTIILMFGHFTIIPFIAPYMQLNVGFSEFQITYIYLIGGVLSAILLPYFGQLADRIGHIKVFTVSSVLALFSIYAITNLPVVPIALALVVTSSFFVVASGRNVPATTMITAVVKPESRAGFMSIRSSANELALFISSFVAGMIVEERTDGGLLNYQYVGYIAIAMSILAIGIARQLKLKA